MIYYCCKSFRNLNKMNYIETDNKGQPAVYLQSIEAKTKIPQELMHYRYCIQCGIDTALHPITILKDPNKCDMLEKGLIHKEIALNFGQKEKYEKAKENYEDLHHDHYIFNLNSLTEINKTQSNISDYPLRTILNYCPYCGYGYSIKNEIQNTTFLIRMNYLI